MPPVDYLALAEAFPFPDADDTEGLADDELTPLERNRRAMAAAAEDREWAAWDATQD